MNKYKILFQVYLRWLRRFFKHIRMKKQKSISKAEISNFLMAYFPNGVAEQIKQKKKFNRRTFLVRLLQALMGRRAYVIKHKFFKSKVVNNSPLPIDYNHAFKNSSRRTNFSENFMH